MDDCMNHSKLVRDKVPDFIRTKGTVPRIHIASDEEYRQKLKEKLQEEVNEFLGGESPEELADILEVVYALAAVQDIDQSSLEARRKKKAEERDAFSRHIILDEMRQP